MRDDVAKQWNQNFPLLFSLAHRIDGKFERLFEFSDNLPAVHHGLLFDGSSLSASWAA